MSEQIHNQEIIETTPSIIKVFGVGGGGSNAVKHMFNNGIINVEFFICNTDAQALEKNPVVNKIQIGQELTEGRGAGNNPNVGKKAAEESTELIRDILGNNTKMLFITAGMGGGTGTGAAPVIARIAKELGILTVAIITIPFDFEGKVRLKQAINGVQEIEQYVDSLLVINNEKLRRMHGDQKISEAFAEADEVLSVAAKGIAEIITVHGQVNVDFADVETVMKDSGVAIMGSATAGGENRSMLAIKKALNSPLLNSSDIRGARNVLLNVTSGSEEFRLDELGEITDYVQSAVKEDVQIIWGNGNDEALGEKIRVVIIATGFKKHDIHDIFAEEKKILDKQVIILDDKNTRQIPIPQIKFDKELDSPQVDTFSDTGIENNNTGNIQFIEMPGSIENKVPPGIDTTQKKEIPRQIVMEHFQEVKTNKQSALDEERKRILSENQNNKKKKKSAGKKMGDWIQTTLDSMFNEEVS